jgi:hypothetical protein
VLNGSFIKILLFAALLWGGWSRYAEREVHPADGEIAPTDPQQIAIAAAETIKLGDWTLTPRAHYVIIARVLGHEHYRFDALADLIPEDLALGWGPMSDNAVLKHIDISQSGRFYFWKEADGPTIDRDDIAIHSANTHVIPNDSTIARQLSRIRVGQIVQLTGDLVDGIRDDGRWIKSSLVRNDTGAGACEVLLVRNVELVP